MSRASSERQIGTKAYPAYASSSRKGIALDVPSAYMSALSTTQCTAHAPNPSLTC